MCVTPVPYSVVLFQGVVASLPTFQTPATDRVKIFDRLMKLDHLTAS